MIQDHEIISRRKKIAKPDSEKLAAHGLHRTGKGQIRHELYRHRRVGVMTDDCPEK
jgi:hypothetical protein